LRRSKEALISVALRLQVAIKVAQEDELTMSSLLSQAEAAKAKEIIATKKVDEATETINALSIEVNSLKRKLRIYESAEKSGGGGVDGKGDKSIAGSLVQQHNTFNTLADSEIDYLFDFTADFRSQIPNYIDPTIAKSATPFDRWKMNEFLYAPNTPAGSKAHDSHVLQMLLQSSMGAVSPEKITRPTKASIARSKRILTESPSPPRDRGRTGTRDLSPLGGLRSPHQQRGYDEQEEGYDEGGYHPDPQYFLTNKPNQLWGSKNTFNRDDLGRLNLWSTQDKLRKEKDVSSSSSVHRPVTTAVASSSASPKTRGNPSLSLSNSSKPVKLKSLRLPSSSSSSSRPTSSHELSKSLPSAGLNEIQKGKVVI
jgi:hypothetical protein